MKLTNEQDECYETEMGTPTLTIELSSGQRMIPYAGFRDAVFKGDSITIRFLDWIVVIMGKSLLPLWRQLQMQDVRIIRHSLNDSMSDCSVTAIDVREADS